MWRPSPRQSRQRPSVPFEQRFKSELTPLGDEALQQLSVRPVFAHSLQGNPAELVEQSISMSHRYDG
jgi:hypothetical protein